MSENKLIVITAIGVQVRGASQLGGDGDRQQVHAHRGALAAAEEGHGAADGAVTPRPNGPLVARSPHPPAPLMRPGVVWAGWGRRRDTGVGPRVGYSWLQYCTNLSLQTVTSSNIEL